MWKLFCNTAITMQSKARPPTRYQDNSQNSNENVESLNVRLFTATFIYLKGLNKKEIKEKNWCSYYHYIFIFFSCSKILRQWLYLIHNNKNDISFHQEHQVPLSIMTKT